VGMDAGAKSSDMDALIVDATDLYVFDSTWPAAQDRHAWFSNSTKPSGIAIGIGADGKTKEVHMTQRGNEEFPISTFDAATGQLLRRWGSPHVVRSHGLRAHTHGAATIKNTTVHDISEGMRLTSSLWLTDMGDYTVKQFDAHTGELLRTLGTPGTFGSAISPQLQFGNVSDIVVSPDGSAIFIADGDCLCLEGGANHRVMRLTATTGAVEWVVGNGDGAMKPPGGSFQNPHAIDLDTRHGLLWVADRENNRTVALDAKTGAPRGEWSTSRLAPENHRPSINGLRIDNVRGVLGLGLMPAPIHSAGGEFQFAAWDLAATLADPNKQPASLYQEPLPLNGVHEIAVDEDTGDFYIAFYETGDLGRLKRHLLMQ